MYALVNVVFFVPVPRPLSVPPPDTFVEPPPAGRIISLRNCARHVAVDAVYWARRGWLWLAIHMKYRNMWMLALWLPSPVMWFFACMVCFASKTPPAIIPLGPLTNGPRVAGVCYASACFGQYPVRYPAALTPCYVVYVLVMVAIVAWGFQPVSFSPPPRQLSYWAW